MAKPNCETILCLYDGTFLDGDPNSSKQTLHKNKIYFEGARDVANTLRFGRRGCSDGSFDQFP